MFNLKKQIIFLFILLSNVSLIIMTPINAQEIQTLKVAIYADGGGHRIQVRQSLKSFQKQNPNINIKLTALRGVAEYNKKFNQWITAREGPDVLFWYGGSRIRQLSKKGLIHNLTSFWNKNQLDNFYPPSITDAIKVDKQIYAIPNTVLLWTFYFNKTLFEKFKINPPANWQELLNTCELLRANNIDLFSIGTKGSEWITHGWFDYLNLRLNGIEFYYQLSEGKVSYYDSRVKNIFLYWKQLIDKQCFNKDHNKYNIWESFPKVLRGYSAISLLDGIPTGIENISKYNIGLIPFPTIDPNQKAYTVQPINVFVVPSYVNMNDNLEKLLLFMSNENFQTTYNDAINRTSSHIHSYNKDDALINLAKSIISQSPGSVQYFDRETDIDFARFSPKIFVDFINNPDIERTLLKLEKLRTKVFGKIKRNISTKKKAALIN